MNQLHITLYVFSSRTLQNVLYDIGRGVAKSGNDKYVLPMTLSEALKDDLAAIEAGVLAASQERSFGSIDDVLGTAPEYWERVFQ